MFHRWGAFVYRQRRIVALITFAIAILAIPFASRVSGELSSGGWLDPSSEASQVSTRLATEFGSGRSSVLVLFRSTAPGANATGAPFQAAVAGALAPLRADPHVAGVVGYAETGDARFISTAGDAAYVVVSLNSTDEESVAFWPDLRTKLVAPSGFTVGAYGYATFALDTSRQADEDLRKAETVSLPIVAVVLFLVFTSVVAAGMPLLVAGLAIPTSLAIVFFVAKAMTMSVFVLNIASMLGLALAIDYSLFIVSRFREELARGHTVGDAVARAVATSGKAVLFSGVAVAIGLSGLMVFPFPTIRSIGLGSALVVTCSVFFALTFLPATLGMLGHRVNRLSWAGFRQLLRGDRGVAVAAAPESALEAYDPAHPSRWGRLARQVMAHPWLVLVPVAAALVVVGTPILRMEQGVPGAEVLPAGLESHDTYVALRSSFPPGETTPMIVLADVNGDPTSPANVSALQAYAARLAAVPGVSRVESFFTLVDPTTGKAVLPAQVQLLFSLPPAQRPAAMQAGLPKLLAQYTAGSAVRLNVLSPAIASNPEATSLVPIVRDVDPGPGISQVQVGGVAAMGADFFAGQASTLPLAIGWTMLAIAVTLFLLFGSIVIPAKAVVLTLLSASASFGALVWVFQDGNLAGLFRFDPPGFTIAGIPIIMFCVIFGLSMDYEVLLLSRIQEAWRRTGDSRAAVTEGLVRTARVITGAALIMVCVFAAFVLADEVTIKAIGVGMAVAVAVDATIVRMLLVPATMRLLGKRAWWAPGPLGRLAESVGFSHVEDADADVVPAPGGEPRSGLASTGRPAAEPARPEATWRTDGRRG